MSGSRRRALVAAGLLVAAAGLRFHRLGDWCFASDEISSFSEVTSLFEGQGGRAPVFHALPRVIPLGYLPLRWTHRWLGQSEWSCRLPAAVLGSLTVAVCFLLLAPSLGSWTAFFAGAGICLLPDHVFQSQYHRFYSSASVLGWTSLALGGLAISRRSGWLALLGTVLGATTVLAHTVWTAMLGATLIAFAAALLVDRRTVSRRMLLAVLAGPVLIAPWIIHIWPRVSAWNVAATWGYSPIRSVLAAVSQLSWPVALLAAVGFAWGLGRRSGLMAYWVVLAVMALLGIALMPLAVVYQPHYGFLLVFPFVVLAAMGAEAIRRSLWAAARPAACAWVAAAVLLPMPGLVSYYADGSRYDYASAADYLRGAMGAEDRVACDSAGILGHYLAPGREVLALPPEGRVGRLAALARERGALWVVLASGRAGLAPDVRQWLGRQGQHERHFEAHRLDYYRFCVDVFVIR